MPGHGRRSPARRAGWPRSHGQTEAAHGPDSPESAAPAKAQSPVSWLLLLRRWIGKVLRVQNAGLDPILAEVAILVEVRLERFPLLRLEYWLELFRGNGPYSA